MKTAYQEYLRKVSAFIPQERIYTDELRRLAWGTDAGSGRTPWQRLGVAGLRHHRCPCVYRGSPAVLRPGAAVGRCGKGGSEGYCCN